MCQIHKSARHILLRHAGKRPVLRSYSPGWFAVILAVCLVCSPAQADDNPPPGATLEATFTCSLQPVWNDKRSRADLDGFFYLPNVGPTEYIVGGYGNRNKTLLTSDCVLTLRDPAYLAAPAGWELVWKDKGSGAMLDGSMWRAIPPSEDYRCVGHVPQEGYDEPYIPNYRCVHAAFTEELVTGEMIWSDKGSGADKPVTMLHLPNTRSFVAVGARVEQLEAYDLRVDHSTATGEVVVVQAGGSGSTTSGEANADSSPEQPEGHLSLLAHYGDKADEINALLEQGADPNMQGALLRTALHEAAIACQPSNLALLLRYGGDPRVQDQGGNAPLHYATGGVFPAARGPHHCTTGAIKALLDADADPNQVNAKGDAPLHAAMRTHHFMSETLDNVKALLQAGADPNLVNAEGDAPLHAATGPFGTAVFEAGAVNALLSAGAQPDAANHAGMTPLMLCALNCGGGLGAAEVITLLLDAGADPDRKTPEGAASLHLLVREPQGGSGSGTPAKAEVVEALLAGGADPCVRDADGMIPYELVDSGSAVALVLENAGGALSSVISEDAEGNSFRACRADEERAAVVTQE